MSFNNIALLNSEVDRILNCKPHLYNYKSGNDGFPERVTRNILIKYEKLGAEKAKPIHEKANI